MWKRAIDWVGGLGRGGHLDCSLSLTRRLIASLVVDAM